MRISPLGDTALLAELSTRLDTAINTRAIALAAALKKRRDVRQAIAGYASVTVQFDPELATHDSLSAAIKRLAAKRPPMTEPGRLHRIPVNYDGPDIAAVGERLQLTREKIIELHSRPIYRVFLVGFVPGWAYSGLSPKSWCCRAAPCLGPWSPPVRWQWPAAKRASIRCPPLAAGISLGGRASSSSCLTPTRLASFAPATA